MDTLTLNPIPGRMSDFRLPQNLDAQQTKLNIGFHLSPPTLTIKNLAAFLSNVLGEQVQSITITQADIPAGEPYRISAGITGIVKPAGSDWVAEIPEANLGTSGETAADAWTNVVLDLLDTFYYLSENEDALGPEPARQLNYLRTFIAKTND